MFVLTCYFFFLDLQTENVKSTFKPPPPISVVKVNEREARGRQRASDREGAGGEEMVIGEEKEQQEEGKFSNQGGLAQECEQLHSSMLIDTSVQYVRRYIDSYTYSQEYEEFHPKDDNLIEAEKVLDEGLSLCDWRTCSEWCVNATVYAALLNLKKDRPQSAKNYLERGFMSATNAKQRSKLNVYRGFVAEYSDQLRPQGFQYYQEAVEDWSDNALKYMAVIRYDLPDDAPREEKMKIYYYGRREEIIALTDGLLALEFYPDNLQRHPILRSDEPNIFWNPEGEKQYKLIKQLQSPFIQTVNARMMAQLIDNGHLDFKDPQATRFFAYNERFSRFFQFNTIDVIRKILGRPVIISYTYFGGYVGGSTLAPHRDRPACEYTMSLCVDTYPHGYSWGLGINKVSKPGVDARDLGGPGKIPPEENIVYARLQPGDSFIFQGRHKVHWRDGALPDGHMTRVYFYHYVNEDYVGSLT
eukprot:CAMPEP_0201536950 /NCGR_PEP_ID=MMETSP0161_2-20130828/63361_1 /ASSEMBLY_ACC=CAM_ASM_000251 /TAXON_ID=180227 /ORGANISM="Neoparamoeba aestuarina, Strain SoJaBio B1-5/56/2" /LENGTH=471 /DNA_ID=CAMNT_0047942965 /DNA_START=85 /DNA_END=1500 /DNA_ORIENTATION=-